jgi:hypothetical protein
MPQVAQEQRDAEPRARSLKPLQLIALVVTTLLSLAIPYSIGFAVLAIEAIYFRQLPKPLRLFVGVGALGLFVLFWATQDTSYSVTTTTGVTR